MRWLKTFSWMVVVILAVLFSVQNRDEVTLRFVFLPLENYQWLVVPEVPLPLFLVILCAVLLGMFVGGIGDLYRRLHLKRALRENQRTIERLEKEIESLRGPVLDQPSFLKREG